MPIFILSFSLNKFKIQSLIQKFKSTEGHIDSTQSAEWDRIDQAFYQDSFPVVTSARGYIQGSVTID